MTKAEAGGMGAAEQEKMLEEALRAVRSEAFAMKRCLDQGQLMEALKHASQLLSELRTSDLSPKYYYRLYIDVTNEVQHLQLHLVEEFAQGRKVSDLYELVQYAGNIIPRMYLLITIGIVYMKTGEWKRSEVLRDLVEMCRGVQHPLRGLFLRNYLVQCTRNLLPDSPEDAPDADGSVRDSVDFVMVNLAEMNKLWVRMQHQGPSREQERREKERRELRILVGTNLVRLSQLEQLSPRLYQKLVLPGILEQVVSCKDPLAQEYLMDSIIQVFPDELHLLNLKAFLAAAAELHPGVNVKNVLIALIERLATYAVSEQGQSSEAARELQLFQIFNQQVSSILEQRTSMPREDAVGLELALLSLALKCYPARQDFADSVFKATAALLKAGDGPVQWKSPLGKEVGKILRLPCQHYKELSKVVALEGFGEVVGSLEWAGKRAACAELVSQGLEWGAEVGTAEEAEAVLGLLSPLLRDDEGESLAEEEAEDVAEEQLLVGRFLQLFRSEDPDAHALLLSATRKAVAHGGPKRVPYTFPPLVFAALRLARRFHARAADDPKWEAKVGKMFKLAHSTTLALQKETESGLLPLRLFLQGALLLDQIPFKDSETLAYEFFSQAFSLYEDEISESREQVAALGLMVGTLERVGLFSEESHEPLRTQAALAAAKLFKKPDQCKAVAAVAQVFWSGRRAPDGEPLRDGQRVHECLKKALKIASQCMDPAVQTQLFVHVLQANVDMFQRGVEEVTTTYLSQLVSRIAQTLPQLEPSPETQQTRASFECLTRLLKQRLQSPADGQRSYEGLAL